MLYTQGVATQSPEPQAHDKSVGQAKNTTHMYIINLVESQNI